MLGITPSLAATYRCQDTQEVTILTDTPAQLKNCVLLLPETSSQPVPPSRRKISKTPSERVVTEASRETLVIPEVEENEDSADLKRNTPEKVMVPVTALGGSLVVSVQLNHQRTAQLILDTGATITVLSHDVATDLGLIADTQAQLITINTAGGSVQVNMTYIETIQVGRAEANRVAVAIHDLPDAHPGIDGLLGMSFLNHFQVTLDTVKGQLHLQPRRS